MGYNEWQRRRLSELTIKIGSGSTPRGGNKVYKQEGVPLIRSQNVYNCSFSVNGLVFIDEENAQRLLNVEIEKDDILLNITGDSVARCTKVPTKYIGGRVNQHVAIIRANRNLLVPDFLKYYLVTPYMQEYMLSLARMGGTRAALTKGMIESFEISLPQINEQKSITRILSGLDEKIEINTKINQNLEEMAQAIFKHWFMDFEFPDENGNPYKSSGGEMVESELGLIPKGWRVGHFSDFIEETMGGDWGKPNPQRNYIRKVNILRGADILKITKGMKGNLPVRYILENNFKKKELKFGNLVIEISGGSPTQSTGRITYVNNDVLQKFSFGLVCTNFCRAITLRTLVIWNISIFIGKYYTIKECSFSMKMVRQE